MKSLKELVDSFREASADLLLVKAQTFPVRSWVQVSCPGRYVGPGQVMQDSEPADQLAVRLDNGNTWWYPIEACTPDIELTQKKGQK